MDIKKYWNVVLKQDEEAIRSFFHKDAYVNWCCTKEHFTVEEYWVEDGEPPKWRQEMQIGKKLDDFFEGKHI